MIEGRPFDRLSLRRTGFPAALLAGLLFLSGCGLDYERDATELADQLYAHLAEGDYEEAAALYSDAFYNRISRDRWVETLGQIDAQLGRYERHSLIQAREQAFGPEDDPGEVFTVLMYRVHYGQEQALEQLTFSAAQTPIRLVNHQVMSDLVAVNLDAESDRRIRVASAETRGRDSRARDEQPAPDETDVSEEEPDPETAVAETEPVVTEPVLEDLIAAEVARITQVQRDPDTERFVRQLDIRGINPRRNRILIDTRMVEEGERLNQQLSVILKEVEARRIVFEDESGARYEKPFLTASP